MFRIAAMLFCGFVGAAMAAADRQGVVVTTERFVVGSYSMEVEFSVWNGAPTPAEAVFVACTFFDTDRRPRFTQAGMVREVAPNGTARGTVRIPAERGIENASCRLSDVRQQ